MFFSLRNVSHQCLDSLGGLVETRVSDPVVGVTVRWIIEGLK